jgi:hypothetical protein
VRSGLDRFLAAAEVLRRLAAVAVVLLHVLARDLPVRLLAYVELRRRQDHHL